MIEKPVRLKEAVYCYVPNSKDACVLPYLKSHIPNRYWTTGAVFVGYNDMGADKKRIAILIAMCQSILRDGVDANAAIRAVANIPEIRYLFADDVPL